MTKAIIQDLASVRAIKPLPAYVVTALCWLFAILFGVWALPHTVFVRHTAMVLGAALGLYVIAYLWKNSLLKMQVHAIPILLILALFAWVTIHLLWIGKEYDLQWFEYARIWKKIFLCFPFALGLGMGVRYVIESGDQNQSKKLWRIIYFGLCLPTLIFFFKFGLTKWANVEHIELNPHLILSEDLNFHSGMPKYFYVFFSLPAFAVALGSITHAILKNTFRLRVDILHIAILGIVPIIFHLQSDRNGMLYAAVLLFISFAILGRSILKRPSTKQLFFGLSIGLILVILSSMSLQKSPQWKMLIADAKVAINQDKIDNWKFQGKLGVPYPLNEYGVMVSPSNYERVAWGLAGIKLLPENPLGYGLMTLSFDHLTKAKWPNSFMSQTHSAWLDFALGYGIPGVGLLAMSLLLAWHNSKNLSEPWCLLGRWGLGVLGLVMLTTEISSEIFIGGLIFIILMISALTINLKTSFSAN